MKSLILTVIILSLSFTLLAQNRKILTPDGKLHSINEVRKVKVSNKFNPQTINYNFPSGTIDTLRYNGPWNVNWGFFCQDWMLQWFQSPADLVIKKVGFACSDNNDNMDVEVKVVKVSWTIGELINAEALHRGYYEALGNGYNDVTAFLDNSDRTGGWTSIQPGYTEPFGEDIWSFNGKGFQITPVGNPDEPILHWVDLSILEEPEILHGDIFGIAIKHTGSVMDTNRIGFWASGVNSQLAWKFYSNGRLDPGVDFGWWTREFTFNFAAEVDFVGNGCRLFFSFTPLNTTISTEPRLLTTSIFGDHPFHPLDVKLRFSTDNGNSWLFNSMVYLGGDDYEVKFPDFLVVRK